MKYKIIVIMRLFLFMAALVLVPLSASGQSSIITGKVYDEQGLPIPGASIIKVGTSEGTVTDFDGNFSINASIGDVLKISFIGFKNREIEIKSTKELKVAMSSDTKDIEEVMVVAYGVQKKESVVGAVSQVSGEKLKSVKMGGSIENTLQGSLPGLTVIMTDPTPGEEAIGGYYAASPIQMAIRGTSSMGNNNPLVIVDGVERKFSNIDPNEIASISILKDASATAVYGVKGANGVIIVNTKRGRAGAVELDFSANFTMKEAAVLPEYMNSYETMLLRNEAWKNDGKWDMLVSDEELEHYKNQDLPYLYPDFNWMDYLFEPGFDQSYNLNARGGNDFVQYFVSLGYLNEGDIFSVGNDFPYDYDKKNAHYWHRRYNFRNNLDFNLTNTTKLSVNLGGNIKVWNKPEDTFTQELWFSSPTVMAFYPEDAIRQYPDDVIPYNQTGTRPMINPDQGEVRLNWMGGQGFIRKKANEINSDLRLTQALDFITPGLSVSGLYSYNSQAIYNKTYRLDQYFGYYLDPITQKWMRYTNNGAEDFDTPQPPLTVSNSDDLWQVARSHYYEGQLNYNRQFEKHNVGVVGVFSRRESRGINDFPHYEENWVGRGTYNFDNRYFFEASVAHTGSEKFAPGLRFGTFPAFAAGWMVSNEKFFLPITGVMNSFKIKYSWGKVGSDAGIDRWLYISEYAEEDASVGFGYPMQYYPYIKEGQIPVTDATWEEAIKQNLGFEMAFFKSLISINVDLFNERRKNMLQQRMSVPSYVGVSEIRGNLGETKSHGIEIDVSLYKQLGNGLGLLFDGNLSMSENRVVYYDEPEKTPFNLRAEGKPVDIGRRIGSYTPGTGLVDQGFYQDFDELFIWPLATGGSPIEGDLKFMDFNGDGSVDKQDWVVAKAPTVPNVTWNAKLGLTYKKWYGDVSFYGISAVQTPMRQGGMFYLYPFSQNKHNAYTAHANHWTPTNTNPEFPSVHTEATNQYNYQISNYSMIDGQYVRLRNARIGYNLEIPALKTIGVKNMSLALVGTNLYTWKKRSWGGDPEGFNYGVDFGAYPQTKRYTLELNVTF
ncbi:SusC/RagA family TonB-linked outer membrane protein [Plebeiibacterium sediminum]|uniref:TonB-dependent receptor n=1 Tax=Plebeiibacterium sediminum TaxID=2992112 RepID=A0AAE3M344_9BACT|nr:TonB-dependent receptor [Plebeiobacterium sediminum]MCW3786322.1 TonB-dependent receptor [Plebeiobacterium sediminum]